MAQHESDELSDADNSTSTCGLRRPPEVISTRYSELEFFDFGGSSDVASAKDLNTGKKVAIKFPRIDRDDALHRLREIKYLSQLTHENVVRFEDALANSQNLSKVYIVMELMDCSLLDCLVEQKVVTTVVGIQKCMFQVLNGLQYIHSSGIVHRDMKLGNVLVKEEPRIFKIADFNLSRRVGDFHNDDTESEVTTASYKAPENALQQCSYPMDLWSTGCILYYLFEHKAFVTGTVGRAHISLIIRKMGLLDADDVSWINDEQLRNELLKSGSGLKVPWRKLSPNAPTQALELFEGLMHINPHRRLTAEEALNKDFVSGEKPVDFVLKKYDGKPIEDYPKDTPKHVVFQLLRESITFDLKDELQGLEPA